MAITKKLKPYAGTNTSSKLINDHGMATPLKSNGGNFDNSDAVFDNMPEESHINSNR